MRFSRIKQLFKQEYGMDLSVYADSFLAKSLEQRMQATSCASPDDYRILVARIGHEALEMFQHTLPDAILLDLMMPGMDGIQAFKEIRQDTACQGIPVIALTASAMTSDREAILAHGVDGYIPKPIDHQAFMRTIREVLHGE
jgi:CheY-like chemotaxis protein